VFVFVKYNEVHVTQRILLPKFLKLISSKLMKTLCTMVK
jgi:hypothetical protein